MLLTWGTKEPPTHATFLPSPQSDQIAALKKRIDQLELKVAQCAFDPSHYPIPSEINFCGERISLKERDRRVRFESEIFKILNRRVQVALYIKRARSAFPVIEDLAQDLDICADLKYVAVVESALKSSVVSHAKAVGWWQFMPNTASDFKLQMNAYLDERADLIASTRAALTYLNRLNKIFKGSWMMAMAGYNTGPGRLRRTVKLQQRTSYWELDLITEAERYSPRVLAMYYVLTHLETYGFGAIKGWPPEPLEVYSIYLSVENYKKKIKGKKELQIEPQILLKNLALALDVPLRDLQRHNPHVLKKRLPIGVNFHFYLPAGHGSKLATALGKGARFKLVYQNRAARQGRTSNLTFSSKMNSKRSPSSEPQINSDREYRSALQSLGGPLTGSYTVASGDQLWQIAARAQISVERLRALNGLTSMSYLKVGQRLRLTP